MTYTLRARNYGNLDPKEVPRAVGAAAEAALAARGDEEWFRRVFSQSRVPMMLADDDRNIYAKLDVTDRAAAVAKALRLGLID